VTLIDQQAGKTPFFLHFAFARAACALPGAAGRHRSGHAGGERRGAASPNADALIDCEAFTGGWRKSTTWFFGWVSDRIARELTMFIAFGLEGLAILALSKFGHSPGMFVLLTGLVFFAWGEIYSLFPATRADTFGTRYAAGNAGLLYTAKGTASLLVPLSSMLTAATGGWHIAFWIAAGLNIATALLAVTALGPLRRRMAR
jgi:predicted MFS family arabinose efflux permease